MLWRKEQKIGPMSIPKDFFSLATSVLDPYLAGYGFAAVRDKLDEKWHADRVYRKAEQYVKVTLDVHPYDGNPWSNAIFGVGSNEYPDADSNATALWRIARDAGHKGAEYLVSGWTAEQLFTKIRSDLELYGQPFLTGDLEQFLKVRAAMNADREPTKIYSPDSSGKYSVTIKPESESLKERYSKPE